MTGHQPMSKYDQLADAVSEFNDGDLSQTKRVHSLDCFEEVRISYEPAFGLRIEADVKFAELEVNGVVPMNIENSRLNQESTKLTDTDENVTGFSEAIPDGAFEKLIRALADGADNSIDTTRESIEYFGHCSQTFAGDSSGVAIFASYFAEDRAA